MIDTIKIWIDKEVYKGEPIPIEAICEKLDNSTVNPSYDKYANLIKVHGMIRNFNVTITQNKIWINGSLCKFLKGNNIETLTPQEIKESLKTLSRLLNIPIFKGCLSRVDFGRNFEMKNNVVDYFKVLKETPHYSRNINVSELKYLRKEYTLSFYDKGKEIADKSKINRRKYTLNNLSKLLRYELKLESNVAKRLNYNRASVVLLFSPIFLKILNDNWYQHFNNIVKEKIFSFSQEINGVKELRLQIELAGIVNFGGEAAIKSYIDNLRKINNWTYKQVHDANKMIDKIVNTPALIDDVDLVLELNTMIESSYNENVIALTPHNHTDESI